jgi:TonB-linked SusC/RagA family outer membrane protein
MKRVEQFWLCVLRALALLLLAAPPAAAQTGTIRGTVTDSATGLPIAGAQVFVVGTNLTAASDAAGEYSVAQVPVRAVGVRVRMVGYSPREQRVTVEADGETVVDFRLESRPLQLEEIVVTGYGTQTRGALSSAVSSVGGSELQTLPVVSLDQALLGKAAGVQVIQNGGNPGNGISIRVRGSASVTASNQPLYVVDGVPVNAEDISQIDLGGQDISGVTGLGIGDIESIDILKDAGATAIYGSRGSNGVVVITTKRGAQGAARVSFNAYTGTQSVGKRLKLLNSSQYLTYMNEAAENDGYGSDYFGVVGVDDTVNTDWQDAVFRRAPITNIDAAVSGGGEGLRYRVSGNFLDQTGVVIGSDYRRIGGRVNLDFGRRDRVLYTASLAVTGETNRRIENDNTLTGVVTNAIANQPTLPIQRSTDGQLTGVDDGLAYANAVALARYNDAFARTTRVLGTFEASAAIGGGFRANGRVGIDLENLRETQYESPRIVGTYAAGVNGVTKSAYSLSNRYVFEGYGAWDGGWGGKHALNLTAGSSLELTRGELNYVRGEGLSSEQLHEVRNASRITVWDGLPTENNLISYFARANYSYADRYLFGASARVDGSSRFGVNDRYGFFPAVSGAWVASEESFLRDSRTIDFLKLRASFGLTGNQAISDFPWQGLVCSANYSGDAGLTPCNLANPDLRWERTSQFNLGLDLTLFSGRVSLTGDFYRKQTNDLLVSRPITGTSGLEVVFDNIGNVRNTGVEVLLTTEILRPARRSGLGWTTSLNVAHNRNRVTKLFGGQPITGGFEEINRVAVGHELGEFFTYKFEGVDPATGDAIFTDKDGDGAITSADRFYVGSPWPDLTGGLTNTLTFRNFDLSFFFQFSKGAKVYNAMRSYSDDGGYYYDNKFRDVLRRWQQPGDVTDQPRASFDGNSEAWRTSSRFIEDGDYIRLQDLTVGYQIPERFVGSMGFTNARIYATGHNLFTITDYSGYFPDVNSFGSSSNISLGMDFYAYPIARTFTFGIQAGW